MNSERIDALTKIKTAAAVRVPITSPALSDWQVAEQSIGIEFPEDYKLLVTALGSGRFGECLYLRNPRASIENKRLTRERLLALTDEISWMEDDLGRQLYPAPRGVVHVGFAAATIQLFYEASCATNRLDRLILFHRDLYIYTIDERPITELLWDLYTKEQTEKIKAELKELVWPMAGSYPFFTSRD